MLSGPIVYSKLQEMQPCNEAIYDQLVTLSTLALANLAAKSLNSSIM